MRIIAGEFRSRVLSAPKGLATRPTSDRLRETLFNVLAGSIAGARFLDLYAGSGAVGMEALSRGAALAVFVDRAAPAVKIMRQNLCSLGIEDRARVFAGTAGAFLRGSERGGFDAVFLDPPYDAAEEYATALGLLGEDSGKWLAPGGLVVAEHRRKQQIGAQYGTLRLTRILQQGDAALSFYSAG